MGIKKLLEDFPYFSEVLLYFSDLHVSYFLGVVYTKVWVIMELEGLVTFLIV